VDCDSSSIVGQFNHDLVHEVVCNIAGWKNQDNSGSYLTVELSPRVVAKARAKQEDIIGSLIQAFYLNAFAATSGSYVCEEVRTRIRRRMRLISGLDRLPDLESVRAATYR